MKLYKAITIMLVAMFILSVKVYGIQPQKVSKDKAIAVAKRELKKTIKSFEERNSYRLIIEDNIFTVDSLKLKYPYFNSEIKYIVYLLKKLKNIRFWYCKFIKDNSVGGDIHLFINEKNGKAIHLE